MKKIVLTFGVLAGLVMSAMLVAMIPFWDRIGTDVGIGMDVGMVVGYTTMVAAMLFVYFGVRRYADETGDGTVSFGRGFAVGMLIVAVASACYTATWEVVYASRGEEFNALMQAHALESARADGASAAELERKRAEMARFVAMYRNPAINAAFTFLEPLPVGLLAALVSARVLSRRRRRPGATAEVARAV